MGQPMKKTPDERKKADVLAAFSSLKRSNPQAMDEIHKNIAACRTLIGKVRNKEDRSRLLERLSAIEEELGNIRTRQLIMYHGYRYPL